MGNILFVLSIVAMLLFAGCASQPPQAPPAQPPASPPAQPPITPPVQVNNTTVTPPAEPPPAMEEGKCTVEFQKDSSSVYYVMVKTSSTKSLQVICPSGTPAEKSGELYFCNRLDLPNPVIGLLDGKECGRADFLESFGKGSPTSEIKCTVLLAPTRITKGSTTQVTVQAYTPNSNDVLSYLCGTSMVSEKMAGMVDSGRVCRFDTTGTIDIYAEVNGKRCGSTLLEVFDKARECFVLGSSFEMVKGEYSYKARVSGRGYSGSDLLKYKCYDIPHEIKVESIPSSTDFIYEIQCKGKTALAANVPVKIGTDPCGELSLPG
ncbi:TPA: hypothetical protein HA243_05305 [Candidatus Micrarchaeota archaeon]|nr:hypothetical protein [Candidatus Micrarchaeota archaeon]